MLSLLDHAADDMLAMSFEDMLAYLKDFPSTVNAQEIMAHSLKISLIYLNIWRSYDDFYFSTPNFKPTVPTKLQCMVLPTKRNHHWEKSRGLSTNIFPSSASRGMAAGSYILK